MNYFNGRMTNTSKSPKEGETAKCTFTQNWGKFHEGECVSGIVKSVFRVRSGAVLVKLTGETRSFTVPVSKYVEWN